MTPECFLEPLLELVAQVKSFAEVKQLFHYPYYRLPRLHTACSFSSLIATSHPE
jgi:hypothetical protein